MRKLSIIGIGAGNPDYITVQAIKALETLDAVFLIDKAKKKTISRKLRREIASAISRSHIGSSKPKTRSATANLSPTKPP